ncbi:unnamed protein product [Prunus armeniaca]
MFHIGGMDTFEGVSESAEGGVGVGEVRNNVLDSDPSNNNNAVVTQTGKRRRKLTSAVWTPFEILPIDDNNEQRAKCMKYVQDGLKHIDDSVGKIRESIKYVRGSQGRKQKFLDCAAQVSLESNLYFPQVFVVEDTLRKAKVDSDSFMKSMATQMMEKFDKYWKEYSLILAIAVILDPRYKIQFVEFCYKRLYGYNSEEMTKVRDLLFSLFDLYFRIYSSSEYVSGTSSASNGARSHVDDMVSKECLDVMKKFDNFESEEFTTSTQKTQLQLYLDETKIDRKTKLNVLVFWKVNQFRYPELSILARDLLSIPISTVASELAFSVGGRVLDQYRSALKPENVEALVCTRDWIFGEDNSTLAPNLEELTENISKMEINATDSAKGSNTVTVGGQSGGLHGLGRVNPFINGSCSS